MAVRRKKGGGELSMITALKELCAEKEIDQNTLFDAIESALIFACKKTATADKKVVVDLDRDSGIFHVYELRDVVEEVTNRNREISLEDAKLLDSKYEVGSVVRYEVSPNNFGRIAAQAAKQFVMQKIREAERGVVYDEFTNKDNDIVTGTVTRIEDGNVIVDIGKTEAVLVPIEQMRSDRFKVGDRVRAYVAEVRKIGKGPQVYLSRTHPGFLRRIFELEVPEIQEGIIVIKGVAREPGNRSKIAVISNNPDIDPVGACLGEHGVRAQAIAKELGGEKIDVVKWDEDPAIFIANALSPSKVMKVAVSEYEKVSHVVVPNNQLSLAIGKEGQNARLAARITGWKIDIKSKAQAKDDVPDPDLREVVLVADKPKKQKKVKPPKPEKDIQQAQNLNPDGTPAKKKKKKKKKKAAAATTETTTAVATDSQNMENVFGDNLFDENPFGDNPFDDNPFGDDSFDAEEKPVEEKPKKKKAKKEVQITDNIFGDNPFDDNPFGEDSFDAEEKPVEKPAKAEENPFGDNPFGDDSFDAEEKPVEKSAKAEENPFGDNPFGDDSFEVEEKPVEKPAKAEENPFGDNPFGDDSFEVEEKPVEKPAKKKSAKAENPFGDNPFGDDSFEVEEKPVEKPAKKKSAKTEENPFGDNPFGEDSFDAAEKPVEKPAKKKSAKAENPFGDNPFEE